MKRIAKTLLAMGAALIAGCYSMDISTTDTLKGSALSADEGAPIEHVVVANYGWFLFDCLPIVCGNATPGATFPWKFFSNQVTPALLHDQLMAHAASIHADARDLIFLRDENIIFNVPGTNFPLPLPYVLTYREIQFSAVLTQRKEELPPDNVKKRKAVSEMNRLLDSINQEGEE